MVFYCCAFGCKSKFVKGGSVTFHNFPKDENRRKLWEMKTRRKNFRSTKATRICSKHFTDESFDKEKFGGTWLKSDAVPTIFDFPNHLIEKNIIRKPPKSRELQSEQISNFQTGTSGVDTPVNRSTKRLCYIGDFDDEDMHSPTKARKALQLAKINEIDKNSKLRSLRKRNKRLEKRISSLKRSLHNIRNKSLIMDTASDVLETSSSDDSVVENVVVTQSLNPSFATPPVEPFPVITDMVQDSNTAINSKSQQVPTLSISIVDARSVSSPAVTTTSVKRKRKSTCVSKVVAEKMSSLQPGMHQFADVNLPDVEKYRQLYGKNNMIIYNPHLSTLSGIATFNAASIPQTFPVTHTVPFPIMQVQPSQVIGVPITSQVQNKPSEVIVPGGCITNDEEPLSKKQKVSVSSEKAPSGKGGSLEEANSFHNKIRDAISADDEDCDKPLASLIGHPIDTVLKRNIIDIVEQTDLQNITINGVIQKVYSMYPKFDLSYRKEFIKSTVRYMLYKLGEQKNSNIKRGDCDTNSPDCSVTSTDIQYNNNLDISIETIVGCS